MEKKASINNDIYNVMGTRWYTAQDDPVALLRAEARHRNPWIAECIRKTGGKGSISVLDVGCGGGFLSNALAQEGFSVTGIDQSPESLDVARSADRTATVTYERGDACQLPYPDGSFHVVCAMDFLEHVESPARVISEASRVLKPGGMFFFRLLTATL